MNESSSRIYRIFEDINRNEDRSKFIRLLILIPSNWVFQGLFFMDWTERVFKISFTLIITVAITFIMNYNFSLLYSVIAAFMIAHTVNWTFNGGIFSLLKKFDLVHTKMTSIQKTIDGIRRTSELEPSIARVLVYGSLARNTATEKSDIDIRIIRNPGVGNGVRSCYIAFRKRCGAFIHSVPLDLYVFDDSKSLRKMNASEEPIIIYDQKNQPLLGKALIVQK